MKKYKKPKIKVSRIKIQLFTRRGSFNNLDNLNLLACAPSEECCSISC